MNMDHPGMEDMHEDDMDQRILEEILHLMGGSMAGRVKPKMLSVEMAGVKPEEGSMEEESNESPLERALEGDDDSKGDDLDLDSLKNSLESKGFDREEGSDDSDDEFSLRKRGKIF